MSSDGSAKSGNGCGWLEGKWSLIRSISAGIWSGMLIWRNPKFYWWVVLVGAKSIDLAMLKVRGCFFKLWEMICVSISVGIGVQKEIKLCVAGRDHNAVWLLIVDIDLSDDVYAHLEEDGCFSSMLDFVCLVITLMLSWFWFCWCICSVSKMHWSMM